MSTLTKDNIKATSVWFSNDMIFLRLEDGREIGTPLEWYPKLIDASKRDLENWRFIRDIIYCRTVQIHGERIT